MATEKTATRPAVLADRPFVYQSLAQSDATAEMMGLPRYPDHPVPDYQTFCEDFVEEAFTDKGDFRLFIITTAGRDIGTTCYTIRDSIAELDIWIAARKDWGQGHGTRTLQDLMARLEGMGSIRALIMRPSARNPRAIAAYRKVGFVMYDEERHDLPSWCLDGGEDYEDAVILVRLIGTGGCCPDR